MTRPVIPVSPGPDRPVTTTAESPTPTRLLDRLMWKRDEDGEWQHRMAREWDGNGGGHILYERYEGEQRSTSLSCGVTWSQWAFGPHVEVGHERPWLYDERRSVPTRRVSVLLTFGPLYLSLTVVRPRKGFDPHA